MDLRSFSRLTQATLAMLLIGTSPVVFGVADDFYKLPILNLPADTVRVKRVLRTDDFARALVRVRGGIRSFYLARDESGVGLKLVYEQAGNVRTEGPPCAQ